MVLLIATLLLSEEDNWSKRMYFDRGEVKIFRTAITRTNISYCVIQIEKAVRKREVEEITLRMIQQKVRRYRLGKIVIYRNLVAKLKRLAQNLGCNTYHCNAAGKASMLEEFIVRKKRIIVATSTLGIGVDIANIRCIIHVDWPCSMLNYAQESGRAGRDWLASEVIVIAHEGD
jgi:superfamily II DNA helicase RecQ